MVSASALVAGQIGKPTGMLTLLLAAATTQLLDFPRITTTARRTGDGGSGVVPGMCACSLSLLHTLTDRMAW